MLVDVATLVFWIIIGIAGLIILYHLWCCLPSFSYNRKNNQKTIVRLVESQGSPFGCNNRKKKCCKPPKPCFYTVPPPPPPPPPSTPSDDEDCGCFCRSSCCSRSSCCRSKC